MKTKLTTLGLLASLGAAASLHAQSVTAPVGYRTENISPGVFNLLSSNFSNAVAVGGAVEAADATSLTDAGAFAGLTAGTAYTVKLTSGTAGEASVVSFTDDVLTLDGDLGAVAADTYQVRETPTVESVFGAADATALTSGPEASADIVWIPNSSGGFTRVYSNGTQWKEVAVFLGTRENTPVPSTAAVFVESKAAAAYPIVFVGHVETSATAIGVDAGFNFVSRILPVGVTLGDSGLANTVTTGLDSAADVVWNPNGAGGYSRYYVNAAGDWKEVAVFLGTRENIVLQSGFIVQRQTGGAGTVTSEIPSSLDI